MSETSEIKPTNVFEIYCGLTIAVFAAVLAVTDLFAGKYGEDEIKAINEKASALMWYQSKSIKETIAEGQRDLIKSLMDSGTVAQSQSAGVMAFLKGLEKDIERYGREKKEILKGSAAVGPENWAQEIDGRLGEVKGALEYRAESERLSRIGDQLDLATLFLQICLVMGAVSLVLQRPRTRFLFYALMIALGLAGTGFSIYGLAVLA